MMEIKRILTMPKIKNRITCETTFDCAGLKCIDCLVSYTTLRNKVVTLPVKNLPADTQQEAPAKPTPQEKSITKAMARLLSKLVYADSNTGLHCVYCGRESYQRKHNADCPVPLIQEHYAE